MHHHRRDAEEAEQRALDFFTTVVETAIRQRAGILEHGTEEAGISIWSSPRTAVSPAS